MELLAVFIIFSLLLLWGGFILLLEHHKEITKIKLDAIRIGVNKSTDIISNSIQSSLSYAINTFGRDYIVATKTMNTSLTDHMNALNQLISTEFYNAILLPRAGQKNKPPIDDIKANTDMICNRIMDGLQPQFFDIFRYHGISEEFIMSYMTREVFAKLIEFTRTNRRKEI